jgi:hypothetical protein
MGTHGQAEQLAMGDQPESFSEHYDVSRDGLSPHTTENLDSPAGRQSWAHAPAENWQSNAAAWGQKTRGRLNPPMSVIRSGPYMIIHRKYSENRELWRTRQLEKRLPVPPPSAALPRPRIYAWTSTVATEHSDPDRFAFNYGCIVCLFLRHDTPHSPLV